MAASRPIAPSTEAEILARVIRPDQADLPPEAARAFLGLRFDDADLERLQELARRNQDDALIPAERPELEGYLRISSLIDPIRARARRSLDGPDEHRPGHYSIFAHQL